MTDHGIDMLTQFGVAGLMGVLWVWERWLSRRRERELQEAHQRLMLEREHVTVLTQMVTHNTAALERFEKTLIQLSHVLEELRHDLDRCPARESSRLA